MSAESEAVQTALDKLAGTATYGGAVGPSGLTSLLGTNPAQLAAQEAAKAGASTFGLGTLMQGLGPLALAYSVADLLGFFDGSGMVAEETTPEQDALQNIETKVAQAAQAEQAEGGTEGATEELEDAIAQGLILGIAPGDVIAPVLNARIPGITDIPIVGDVLDATVTKVDEVLDYVGLGDYRADVGVSTDGTFKVDFEPKGQQKNRQQGGTKPQGTSNEKDGSTVTIFGGDTVEDILIGGGTGSDVLDAEVGDGTTELIHIAIAATCSSDETYDRATFSCIPKSGTGTKKAEKVTCPEEYENAGAQVDSLSECGAKKSTVTVVDNLCDDPVYAAANPDICDDAGGTTEGTGEITVDDPCLDPDYKAANPIQCGDMGPKLDPCDDPDYAAANPVQCGGTPPPPPDPCDDPAYAAENPVECGSQPPPPEDPCDNPAYAAENPVECGGQPPPPEDPCDNPAYAAENPVLCGGDPPPPPEDPCDNPAYAAENPIECGGTPTDPCLNPAYAAENPVECGGEPPPPDPCDDPVYAAENPVLCGAPPPPDPCDDPAYAAENPAQCDPNYDPCLSPGYAAENPEICGERDPCDDPQYYAENLEECGYERPGNVENPEIFPPEFSMNRPGQRGVVVTPGDVGDIEYFYDISGDSIFAPTTRAASGGKIDSYDLLREVEDLLRGR